MEASLEETTNAKDARGRETDANTDADPVDPDPVDLGNPRKPRDAKGAGGARSKSTRHPSPTNARVVRPKRDTAASGSKGVSHTTGAGGGLAADKREKLLRTSRRSSASGLPNFSIMDSATGS